MEDIHDDNEKEKLTHEIVGNEKEVIEPILNTIRQFSFNNFEANHWLYKLKIRN
jgi:hypothetical protein